MSAQLARQLAGKPHGFKKFLALRVFGDEAQQTKISRMLPDSKERRMIKADEWARIQEALAEQAVDGEPPGRVPLKGYIGAGGEVLAEEFGGDETVEAPAEAAPETVAARVRGTSMYPTFQDGWLIYWSKQLAPDAMMNTIVVAQLEDNRIMVKTIMPGSKPGLWNLVSVNPNTPPMIDQVVRWVAPIDWIRPR